MKRNILLLTAVVLAAVLMTGCIGPFAKVAVEYDFAEAIEDDFNQAELVKKVKRNSKATIELPFAEAKEGETFKTEDYEVTVTIGEDQFLPQVWKDSEGKELGFKIDVLVLKEKVEVKVEAAATDGD